MKNKILIILVAIMLSLTIFTATAKAQGTEEIMPVNQVYKSGIYKLPKSEEGKYNLTYQFLSKNEASAIIVLDKSYDIAYKNINCNRRCNAGTISNGDTIIVVGAGEVAFYFTKE